MDAAIGETLADPRSSPPQQLARSSVQFVEPPPPGPKPAGGGLLARGDQIGRFVVLDVLGAGGMGVVYSAYDPHLDRKVAIKLLGTEVADSSDAQLRLLREAQAMARINHPNVLRVHEAGTHGGRIYVAMEFADGGTLRQWLAAGSRTAREVVAAFVQAGRGLAAAHAAGLVHRDFKPDNVLMFKDGSIRVTDFGLVGLVGEAQPVTAPSDAPIDEPISRDTPLSRELTRTGSVMGTPSYMAPEQFLGQVATTAADQFAFCVALYEGLYRARPFPGTTYMELASSVVAGTPSPAPRDCDVPARLRKIVVRGMSTDPAKRFGSMAELLAELGRDPAKRLRRVLAVAGVLVLAAGGAGAWLALRQPAAAVCSGGHERLAQVWNPAQRAKLEHAFAASGRPNAAAVLAHVIPIVDAWGSSWEQGYLGACQDTHVRKVQSDHLLDVRMECLSRKLDDVHATLDLLASGGSDAVDHALDAVLALPPLATCADTAGLTAAVPPPATPAVRDAVGAVRRDVAAARAQDLLGHFAQSKTLAEQALAAARATAYQPAIAEAMLRLGVEQGRLADHAAPDTLRDAMDTAAAAGDTPVVLGSAAARIVQLSNEKEQTARADDLAQLAASLAQHAPPPPDVAVLLEGSLGQLDEDRGRPKDARAHYERALAIAKAQLGPAHPETVVTMGKLGSLATSEGRFDEARQLVSQVMAAEEGVAGKDSPQVALALLDLGRIDIEQGKVADARQHFEHGYAILSAALGPDHPEVAQAADDVGGAAAELGDLATGEKYFQNGLAVLAKAYGDKSTKLVDPLNNLAAIEDMRGDVTGAKAHLDRAIALIEQANPDDPRLSRELKNAAVIADKEKRYDDALAYERRAEQIAVKVYGPAHPLVAQALSQQATTLMEMKKLPESREMMSRALQALVKAYGPDNPEVANALYNQGALLKNMGDRAGALASYQKAQDIYERKLGPSHPKVASTLFAEGRTLDAMHRGADAVPLLERALAIDTAAKQPPDDIADVRFELAQVLAGASATRARAIAEAKTAVAECQQAKDTEGVHIIEHWLAAHGSK